jgi:hypothetical protein
MMAQKAKVRMSGIDSNMGGPFLAAALLQASFPRAACFLWPRIGGNGRSTRLFLRRLP